jgi:hypothetical protein
MSILLTTKILENKDANSLYSQQGGMKIGNSTILGYSVFTMAYFLFFSSYGQV